MKRIHPHFPEDSPFLKEDSRGKRWAIPYHYECLNGRVDTLLARHADVIQDCRVLDLASHMGTLSYAALQLGARQVHGVDTEAAMINKGKDLFQRMKVSPEAYRFEVKDVFDFLEACEPDSFDTVLCFGLLVLCDGTFSPAQADGRGWRANVFCSIPLPPGTLPCRAKTPNSIST